MYNTRDAVYRKLCALKHNSTLDEFCFQYESVHSWNSLPNDHKLCSVYKQFHSKLNIHIVSQLTQP